MPGLAWRNQHDLEGSRDALLTTMAYVSPVFAPEFWVHELGSYIKAATQCRLDPEAAEWLLRVNDEYAPILGYTDTERREELLARIRAELEL